MGRRPAIAARGDRRRRSRSRVAWPAGAAALGAAALATAATAAVLARAIGGITGDGYGATAKLAELAVCLTLCAWWA